MFVFPTLLIIAALIWICLRHYYTYWPRRGVPQEEPNFILGNVGSTMGILRFRELNGRIYQRYKGVVPFAGIYFFFAKAAIVMDLNLIRTILIRDFSNFQDRGLFHSARDDPLTAHLFCLEGKPWRAMRTKLSPVFMSGKIKGMFTTVVSVAENLMRACDVLVQNSADGAIEIKDLCSRYTADVTGTCAFGIECNSLQDPNAEFRRRGRSMFELPRHSQIVQAFMQTYADLARKLRMKFFSDPTIDFYVDLVHHTVNDRLRKGIKRNDFMDMLIELKAEDEKLAESGKDVDLSDGLTLMQMVAQAFAFVVAGFDTLSTTMSFCLNELALNEEIQKQLRDEIVSVLGNHNGELTYDAIAEMQYLDQVLAETLRKYPVVPHLVRKTKDNYAVPNTQHIFEKDVSIIIPVHAIQHDPDIYPKPEKFDPRRFEPETVRLRHPCAYLPFGDGPRNCIGMHFGKMQAKIGLINLLKTFRFTTSKRAVVPLCLEERKFLATPEGGIYLHVERIYN